MVGGLVAAVAVHAAPVIRFATLTSVNKAPPGLVAQERGLFKRAGVNVQMKLFTTGRSAIEALAAGQYDIGMFGDIPALALLAHGYKGKIIAAGLGGPKRQALVVRRESHITSLKELVGKRIGLTEGSSDDMALQASIEKRGLKWSDFKFVNLPPPAKLVALKTRQVDAIEAWEPVPSIIVVKGVGRRLLTANGDIPDIVGVTIASDSILQAHPKLVERFLKALHEGAVYAREHPKQMVGLLSKRLGLSKKILIQAIPTQWWYVEPYADTVGDWQRSADFMYREGRIKQRLNVHSMVDFSYIAKATGRQFPLKERASQALRYPSLAGTQ